MSRGRVGVVIATRNRSRMLGRTLGMLEQLPEKPSVMVVDNASTDGTGEVARAHPGVALLTLDENLGTGARTLGAERIGTPYVAFSDDDSWWASGALAKAARLFDEHPRLGVVAARILVGPECRLDPTSSEMGNSALPQERDMPGPSVLGFLACGAVVRRSAFLEVGGFDPRFKIGGEEHLVAVDIAAAGWGVCYVDEVVAHHHPPGTRDPRARARLELRNAFWSTWLRRPPRSAAAMTLALLRAHARRGEGLLALGQALRALPWVLRSRRPVPDRIEQGLKRVTAPGL